MGPGEGEHEIHTDGKDYIYFKRLMLDEKFQGQGLGRASMVAALEYFREEYPTAGFVELMHYMDNDTGASLYESVGFESTGEVRRTLRTGTEDEYDEEMAEETVRSFLDSYGEEHFYGWAVEHDKMNRIFERSGISER